MVGSRLVSVRDGEVGHGFIEPVAGPAVACQHRGVAGAGVSFGQDLAGQNSVHYLLAARRS